MPKTARTILEAALAALDDDETETSAEALARTKGTRGSGHNNPTTKEQRERQHGSGTTLSRMIATQERYFTEEGLK